MKISLANLSDLEPISTLIKSCTAHLIENGIFQWNNNYPSENILKGDIELQQLYKIKVNQVIIGCIVLTEIEDEVYKKVKWLTKSENNLYVHRLAIHPNFQGRGYAQKLMDFAEAYAITNNYVSIRLDTFSKNSRNQKFYEQRSYTKLGPIFIPSQSEHPFYCYEKILNV